MSDIAAMFRRPPTDAERIADAARAYVAARLANENAERGEWAEAMIRLDDAWHALLEVSGLRAREETEEGTR